VPDSFAESADGIVLVADGVSRPVRWDGIEPQAVPAGVAAPATAVALSGTGSGSVTGDYVAYVRYVDKYGLVSDLSPASAEVTLASAGTVIYTGIPTPSESRVARRQILRNTAGQESTFYVDIDTTDLSSTALSSTKDDDTLSTQEAVPLLDSNGDLFANRNGLPPDDKPLLAFHLTRMWAAGEVSYAEGSCEVTQGSATVTGRATEWTEEMAGRELHVAGATKSYEIASADADAQTLTLTEPYTDATDAFAAYAIRPFPARQNLLQFSEPNLPESWPATNALELPEDGDRVTGLMPHDSFLYVLKTRRVYRVTAQNDPADDGYIFLTCNRGCVNDRCWVAADEVVYLLDEGGVYAFDGSDSPKSVSTPVQTYFRRTGPGDRVNWAASAFFHAAHSPQEECVRFFVTLRGEYLPRHALCYAYRADKWWVEEYPARVGSSCLGRTGRPTAGWQRTTETPFLGSAGGRILARGGESLDGVPDSPGTLAGDVTGAGVLTLTDSHAAFGDLTAVPVAITRGRGRGQVRVVESNTATELTVDRPWAVRPDSTSGYQVGGIAYRFLSARMRYAPSEVRDQAACEVTFPPVPGATARFTRAHDYGPPLPRGASYAGVYAASEKDGDGTDLDLGAEQGSVQVGFARHREGETGGPRFVRVGLDGVSGDPPVSFGEMVLSGVV
jgi:hypothetical protein